MKRRIRFKSGGKNYVKLAAVLFLLAGVLSVGIYRWQGGAQGQEETKAAQEKETKLPSPLRDYDAFLKERALEKKNKYYSLAALGDWKDTVLLVSEKVQEISNYNYGSCGLCQVYGMVDGTVTLCGEISAGKEDDGTWLFFLDNRLIMAESDAITKIARQKNSAYLVTEKKTPNRKNKKSFSDYCKWQNEMKYGGVEALIFYRNPYVEESGEDGPEGLSLKISDEYYVKEAYVEKETMEMDVTQDGVEDKVEVSLDKVINPRDEEMYTVTLKSGKTDRILWGLPANTVHAGWYGVYSYEEKGKNYLFVFQPAMYQGLADFNYKIFSVDERGKEKILHSDRLQFDLNHPKETDAASFEKFVEGLNQYLRQAEVIVSTLEGNVLTDEDAPADLTYDPTEILKEMKKGA